MAPVTRLQARLARGPKAPEKEKWLQFPKDCSYCLDTLSGSVSKLICGHVFHSKCVSTAMQHDNDDCGICRKPIKVERIRYYRDFISTFRENEENDLAKSNLTEDERRIAERRRRRNQKRKERRAKKKVLPVSRAGAGVGRSQQVGPQAMGIAAEGSRRPLFMRRNLDQNEDRASNRIWSLWLARATFD